MEVKKVKLNDEIIDELIKLSCIWEAEDITNGYRKNTVDDIVGNDVYVCVDNGNIVGYSFGRFNTRKNFNSIFSDDELIFEVEEIYVVKEYRNKGIGRLIFQYIENDLKGKTNFIFLATSTKNYKAILHFYIEEVGMNFHSACLYKRI